MSRLPDFSSREKLTNAAAGNRFATQAQLGIDEDLKAKLFPELFQFIAVSFGTMPKMEICALMYLFRSQLAGDDLLRKFLWGTSRELLVESNYERSVNSGFS